MIVRQVDLESDDDDRLSMTTNVEDRPDLKAGVVLTLRALDSLGGHDVIARKWRIMRLGERRARPRQDWKVGGLS